MNVKDILLWQDVKVSATVFVSCFVLLVCLTQFSVVSVITNVALICLAPMLALRLLLTARSAFLRSEFEHPLKVYLSKDIEVSKDKADQVGEKVAEFAVCLTTKMKRLFLVEDLSESLKLLIVLYILSYVAQWFSGITLMFIVFIGTFTVPKVYNIYYEDIDSCMAKINQAIEDMTSKITSKVPMIKGKEAPTPNGKSSHQEKDNDKKMS